MEQLEDYRHHSAKVPRSADALQRLGHRRWLNVRRKSWWIDVARGRYEYDVAARGGQSLQIVLERPRVFRDIFAGAELRRIHKNCGNDNIGPLARHTYQA